MLLDILGACIDLLSTWYFIRLDNKAWPTGLISSVFNGWLYWRQGIYADMILCCFYCLNFCYGWYIWNQPNRKTQLTSSLNTITNWQWGKLISGSIGLFLLIFLLLNYYTKSTVPILDATTTTLSLLAQWLMCHKIILTWILWFITDALYILLYLIKELPYHALLMLVYTSMALGGFMLWYNRDRNKIRIH